MSQRLYKRNHLSKVRVNKNLAKPSFSKLNFLIFALIFALFGYTIYRIFASSNSLIPGTAYYVDCNSGADINSGTSQSTAWKTLAKASTATLGPGDGILLKKDCVFNNDPLTVSANGNSATNVIIGSYGTGTNNPLIKRNTNGADVKVTGSYITIENLDLNASAPSTISSTDSVCPSSPVGNVQGISFEAGAANNTVNGINASNLYAGVFIKSGSNHNHITNSTFSNNTMMSPLDTAADNDAGAFGILLWGDDNEIANNKIDGSDACSYDYVRDGSAIEVYGGQRNSIHNNTAQNDDAFTELGNNRSSDNTYAYNLFASNLTRSIFLNTRGSANTSFGPVNNTKAYNNTVYLTGSSSQGIVCSSGCSTAILTARNNILWASKSLYADATFNESNNVYWKTGGSPVIQLAGTSNVASSSKKADPLFVSAGSDYHLQSTSPAKDAGSSESITSGFNKDLAGATVPVNSTVDIGAYEYVANTAPPASSADATNPCVGSQAPAQWKHVIVIMFENHTYPEVIGAKDSSGNLEAPYITNLAAKCGSYTNWFDGNYRVDGSVDGNYVSKPSYATLTNGLPPSVHGLKDDTSSTTTSVDNIYNQLRQKGKSGKDYYDASGSTTGCSGGFSGSYHDAIRYYTNIDKTYCDAHDVNLSTFMTDVNNNTLPDFSMILPTNCENMHSCSGITDVIKNGDTWISNFLPQLLNSGRYKSGDTAVFFLWDEEKPIPNVLMAPSVVAGSQAPVPTGNPVTHFSALRTWEDMLALPYLGNTASAPSLLSFFNGCTSSNCTASPPPPMPPPPPTGPKTGDIDGNNSVNLTDLSFLLSSYGQNTTACTTNTAYTCDINSTGVSAGKVDIFDLSALLTNYGT